MTLRRMGITFVLTLTSIAQIRAQVAFSLTSSYPVTSVGGECVAAADVNTDGSTDLILASGSVLYVFTNNGNASFTLLKSQPAYSGSVSSVIAVDVNADNVPDLAATAGTWSGSLTPPRIMVFTNVASPLLEYPAAYDVGDSPRCVTSADVNMDGKVDLISANEGSGIGNTLSILTNNGAGVFATSGSPSVGGPPWSVVALDANGDGAPDLVAGH